MDAVSSLEMSLLRRFNIGDMPKRTAAKYPDRIALVFEGHEITYKELNENCCRMAHVFEGLGAERGDRISFLTHNCLQYVYSWLGACKIGCVANPLNFMLKPSEISYIVNHAEARFFFVEDILIPQVLEAAPDLKSIEKFGIIHINVPDTEVPEGWLSLNELFDACTDTSEPLVETDDDDMCSLMYTSGTEALPKGVMNTHVNWLNTAASLVADFSLSKDIVMLLSIPLYHVGGKTLLLGSIFLGARLVLEYAPNPMEILELTQNEKVTFWVYPPTLYQVLPSMPGFDSYDLSSLTKCESFGAVMPVALLQQWQEILPGTVWYNYYGQTESTPLGSTLMPEDFERKIDSIGRPHTGVEMKIFDEDDNEVPTGEVGEIVMRSPSVMKGYYRDDAKTAETLRGGWLHTGDLGRFDEEGFLYFVDRKKDMIKSGGENVASKEVEDVIFDHEKVMQVAVIGLPHEYWMEAVTAVVVPYPGIDVTEDEIIAYCKERMAGYKVPKMVLVSSDVPTTPTGKILKRVLREQLLKSGIKASG
ncbi:MAG: long-chain-fatty-acid--CoA ligase [Actinobacteria bacterium]|nr:long-chain-fatty-acid--CoA ligase [Actinomycetota bacterium]